MQELFKPCAVTLSGIAIRCIQLVNIDLEILYIAKCIGTHLQIYEFSAQSKVHTDIGERVWCGGTHNLPTTVEAIKVHVCKVKLHNTFGNILYV